MADYGTFFNLVAKSQVGSVLCLNNFWMAGKYFEPPDWEAAAQSVLDHFVTVRLVDAYGPVSELLTITEVTCQVYNDLWQPQLGIPLSYPVSVSGVLAGALAGTQQVYNVAYRLSPTVRDTPFGHVPNRQSHTPFGPIPEGLVDNANQVLYGVVGPALLNAQKAALTNGWVNPGGDEYIVIRVGSQALANGDPDPTKKRSWAKVTDVVYRPQASFLRSRAR